VWAKDDSRTDADLESNLTEYMTALCQRYNGYEHIRWMDVVNETVTTDGNWSSTKPGTDQWENPWTIIGYDTSHALQPPLYIKYAFEIANQCAPDIKQIINQHGSMETVMWDKVKAVVLYLREQGLRVDGIGWQAHIDVGWENVAGNRDALRSLIDWAHANNLEFHVTESNVWLRTEKDWEAQAATFRAIVAILLEKRHTGVVTWNLWHIRDSEAWLSDLNGCMWFEDYTPKPAYYELKDLLLNPPD
jgi:endo-1,4-beta-xylanase